MLRRAPWIPGQAPNTSLYDAQVPRDNHSGVGEMAMFEGLPEPNSRRWRGAVLSFAAHFAFLLVLLHQAPPLFVTPSDVDLGIPHSSGSRSIVYLAPVGPGALAKLGRAAQAGSSSLTEACIGAQTRASTGTGGGDSNQRSGRDRTRRLTLRPHARFATHR